MICAGKYLFPYFPVSLSGNNRSVKAVSAVSEKTLAPRPVTSLSKVDGSNSFYKRILEKCDLRNRLRDYLLFSPSKKEYPSLKQKTVVREDVFIKTQDGEKLHGYFLPAEQDTKKTVIYFHGNDLNVSRWYLAPLAIQKHVPVNVLIIDYRGYGKSTGKPTFQGIVLDALAMYNYLIEKGFKSEDISLYGRSMGGAVALELASRAKVKSVVVQSSITDFRDLARLHYRWIPSFLIKNNLFNLRNLIKKIDVPLLISHGGIDKAAPVSFAYELYSLANKPKKLIIFPGAGHSSISNHFTKEYFQALNDLFL